MKIITVIFNFKSFGFQKNYDTNKHETLIVNDFLFNSDKFINEWFVK